MEPRPVIHVATSPAAAVNSGPAVDVAAEPAVDVAAEAPKGPSAEKLWSKLFANSKSAVQFLAVLHIAQSALAFFSFNCAIGMMNLRPLAGISVLILTNVFIWVEIIVNVMLIIGSIIRDKRFLDPAVILFLIKFLVFTIIFIGFIVDFLIKFKTCCSYAIIIGSLGIITSFEFISFSTIKSFYAELIVESKMPVVVHVA